MLVDCATYGLDIDDDLAADLADHVVAHLRDKSTYEMPDRCDYPELTDIEFDRAVAYGKRIA